MDTVFWYGIGIGAALSLIASIVANLLSNKIQNTVEIGKLKLSTRRARKLTRTYKIVERLHSGKLNNVSFFVVGSTLAIISFQLSLFALSFSLYLVNRYPDIYPETLPEFSFGLFIKQTPALGMFGAGLVLIFMSMLLFSKIFFISQKLNRFAEYQAAVRETHPHLISTP